VDEASAIVSQLAISADDEELLYEDYLQIKLDIALENQDGPTIIELCEEGLLRWPHSTRLKEIQAEELASTDRDKSRQLLREVLCQGEPQAPTVWMFLQQTDKPADQAAREVILDAAEDRRQALAELFSDVMAHHTLLPWNAEFLEWACQEFPDSDTMSSRLVTHYNINGRNARAIELARELFRKKPDHPESERMLGRCLMETDPDQAIRHLEKACKLNRSADYLFDLARCYLLLGDASQSASVHWEALDMNPYLSASWTNLFLLNAPKRKLWSFLEPMLQAGCGVDDEYFLVAAVELAIALRKKLPQAWFPVAKQRLQVLTVHPGFREERHKLRRAVLAWTSRHSSDNGEVADLPQGFFETLAARFFWPRRNWIPAV
jgi:tetratricopeptide (TPR) repeat protein